MRHAEFTESIAQFFVQFIHVLSENHNVNSVRSARIIKITLHVYIHIVIHLTRVFRIVFIPSKNIMNVNYTCIIHMKEDKPLWKISELLELNELICIKVIRIIL